MFLVDTNVISEARKGPRSNTGVRDFFTTCTKEERRLFLASITVGELRRGISLIRYRGDEVQAQRLEVWLSEVLVNFGSSILSFDGEAAQVWGSCGYPIPNMRSTNRSRRSPCCMT